MEPKVSIIVPVYNAQEYLKRCVDSILSQDYRDFELLLMDDGSKDASGEICDAYAQQDGRVRVIHKENSGVSDTRNQALELARGTFLQFLDSDDWIVPEATRLLVRSMEEYNCDMVISDFYRVSGERLAQKGDIEEDKVMPYVSRGGFKLEKALRVFPIDPTGLTCIDCGASTGGFTDVLLQNGAAKVYAVDVGYGQLAWSLRNDPRVISMERTNVRYITAEQIPEPLDLAVMDLSFISVKLILPAVCPLLKDDAAVVCLIKPQFEAGREEVGKKGVVRDPKVHLEVLESFLDFVPGAGFTVMGLDYSPIKGPEGNIEYLGYLRKGTHPAPELDPAAVVEQSHGALAHGKESGV